MDITKALDFLNRTKEMMKETDSESFNKIVFTEELIQREYFKDAEASIESFLEKY